MILGWSLWYWYGAFIVLAVGAGIFCDGIGQGWIHKLKRKKKVKPLGRHSRLRDMDTETYELSEDWKYVVARPKTMAIPAISPDNYAEIARELLRNSNAKS